MDEKLASALAGCLWGTAAGDALGLPAEGLSRRRQRALFGGPITKMRLLFGLGMTSDDTAHTLLTAQALLVSGGEPVAFAQALAREMRLWFLRDGLVGAGLATVRAALKLLLGFGPDKSGVFSAGNGPAMRAAVLGVACKGDAARLREWVRISTRITHTDPKAEAGALAVAWAAHGFAAGRTSGTAFLASSPLLGDNAAGAEMLNLLQKAVESARRGEETTAFADAIGCERGVSGYIFHTVPVALQAAFRFPEDFRAAVQSVVACGGDTDTTAAITGGIVGAHVGRENIPQDWTAQIWEPGDILSFLSLLSEDMAERRAASRPAAARLFPLLPRLFRNAVFLLVVLYHGFRRLLPPY